MRNRKKYLDKCSLHLTIHSEAFPLFYSNVHATAKYFNSCRLPVLLSSWWRHQMEPFSALLALCAGSSPVTGEFPAQRPVRRSFGVFFDLRLDKRLSKQSWGWWFDIPSRSLWRHYNVSKIISLCQTATLWNERIITIACQLIIVIVIIKKRQVRCCRECFIWRMIATYLISCRRYKCWSFTMFLFHEIVYFVCKYIVNYHVSLNIHCTSVGEHTTASDFICFSYSIHSYLKSMTN